MDLDEAAHILNMERDEAVAERLLALSLKLDGNGPVRAFDRTGTCERCGWFGGLDGFLCIQCSNDPATYTEPATIVLAAWVEQLVRQCRLCGVDTDRAGELCHHCHKET